MSTNHKSRLRLIPTERLSGHYSEFIDTVNIKVRAVQVEHIRLTLG